MEARCAQARHGTHACTARATDCRAAVGLTSDCPHPRRRSLRRQHAQCESGTGRHRKPARARDLGARLRCRHLAHLRDYRCARRTLRRRRAAPSYATSAAPLHARSISTRRGAACRLPLVSPPARPVYSPSLVVPRMTAPPVATARAPPPVAAAARQQFPLPLLPPPPAERTLPSSACFHLLTIAVCPAARCHSAPLGRRHSLLAAARYRSPRAHLLRLRARRVLPSSPPPVPRPAPRAKQCEQGQHVGTRGHHRDGTHGGTGEGGAAAYLRTKRTWSTMLYLYRALQRPTG